jgi:hypothetical protein
MINSAEKMKRFSLMYKDTDVVFNAGHSAVWPALTGAPDGVPLD